MNLLVVNWNDLKNPYAGGAEVHLEELLRRLVQRGHEVTLLCSGWPGCEREEVVEGVHIVRRGNRYNFNLVVPFHLRSLARQSHYDLLIEDINKIPFYTPLYLKMPRLVVIPHLFATTVFHEINFILGAYIYVAERPLVSVYRGSRFNVISESTADDIAARGIPRERLSIIHCGIDRSVYCPDPTVSKYEQPTILYLGRIKKYKSIQHVILALKKVRASLSDARLMVVGTGDYLESLRKLTQSLDLIDAVEFPGFVSRKEKVERMRRAHVAVLPSLKEGWGLTNIEANACGTAVVAARTPGLRDSVKEGVSGFLYEYGDVDDLAGKLLAILQDHAVRQRLEGGGLEWADQFNWDTAAAEFETLVIEAAGGGR
jgi:glycosyltransferase involved in cell wall biosynthesis